MLIKLACDIKLWEDRSTWKFRGKKKKDTKPTERLETLAEVPQWSPTSRKCSPIRSHKEDLEDG